MASPRRSPPRRPAGVGARTTIRLPAQLLHELHELRRAYGGCTLSNVIQIALGQWVDGEHVRRGRLFVELPEVIQLSAQRLQARQLGERSSTR